MPRNSFILFAAFLSVAFILLPFIFFEIQSSPHYYAGILDYFRIDSRTKIPLQSGGSIEYDPIKGIRSLPLGEDSIKDIKKSIPDFGKINKDVDEETGIDFFKVFKWIWRGIKEIFWFKGLLPNTISTANDKFQPKSL